MFKFLKKLFEDSNIKRAFALRQQLSNIKMTRSDSIATYFMKISELKYHLSSIGESIENRELVMTTLNDLPPSWEPFILSLSGRLTFPKFYRLWENYTQEETRLATRGKLHGT